MNFMAIDAVLLTGPEKYSLFLSLGYLYFLVALLLPQPPSPQTHRKK